jgi:disulfide bond formation protein DsbB
MNRLVRLYRPFLDRWPLVALLASAAMLAIAHGFETFGHLPPCNLCLKQREVYWVAGTVALVALITARTPWGPRTRALFNGLLGLIFLFGAGLAFFHAGVEWHWWPGPTTCTSTGTGATAAGLDALLRGEKINPPACDKALWVFLGLSMAGWNCLISLKLAFLSFWAARRRPA